MPQEQSVAQGDAEGGGGTVRTQADAKALIIDEWRRWPQRPSKPTDMDMFHFFVWLQRNKEDLLRFRSAGDKKWHVVHGWLSRHEWP